MLSASLTGSFALVDTAQAFPHCLGKERFETRGMANQVLTRMKRRSTQRKGSRLEVYPCQDCQGFHIGGGWIKRLRDRVGF